MKVISQWDFSCLAKSGMKGSLWLVQEANSLAHGVMGHICPDARDSLPIALPGHWLFRHLGLSLLTSYVTPRELGEDGSLNAPLRSLSLFGETQWPVANAVMTWFVWALWGRWARHYPGNGVNWEGPTQSGRLASPGGLEGRLQTWCLLSPPSCQRPGSSLGILLKLLLPGFP